METKKIVISGIVCGIANFFMGWILYGMLFKNYFETQSMTGMSKGMPDFPYLIAGNLAFGFLYALVIGKWANSSSVGDGLGKGILLGLLLALAYDLTMFSTTNMMSLNLVWIDILISTIMGAVTGAIVGAFGARRAVMA
jgi:hypothetical protein